MAGVVSWLHISDWHQGHRGTLDRNVVRDALMSDISRRNTECDPRLGELEFIIFSGDLAFRGTTDEYDRAKLDFLEPLLQAAGLTKDRLFVIPATMIWTARYTLEVKEELADSMKPLRTTGRDELYLGLTRAANKIERVDFILLVPDEFGKVEMKKSSRWNTMAVGTRLDPAEMDAKDLPEAVGFKYACLDRERSALKGGRSLCCGLAPAPKASRICDILGA